jgi:hypothetical protein
MGLVSYAVPAVSRNAALAAACIMVVFASSAIA